MKGGILQNSQVVIFNCDSNGDGGGLKKEGTYTATSDGIISYFCYYANGDNGYGKAFLNGTQIGYQTGPRGALSGCINVNVGDVIKLEACGYKGTTSNHSATVCAVFSTF